MGLPKLKSTTTPLDHAQTQLPRDAVLIVNARSRRGREWFPLVKDALEEEGIRLHRALDLRDPSRIGVEVQSAVEAKVPLVVVGGGDGTFSLVAKHMAGSSSILGVLPLGTGNAFARDLEIPVDPQGASEVLLRGKVADVDLGRAGNDFFVNVATVGLTTRIAEQLSDEAKRRFGRMVYAIAIMRAVTRVRPFKATLLTPEEAISFETLQVVISSGRHHAGPFPVTPEAHITDRHLSGYALTTNKRSVLLKYALSLWGGRHVDLPEVTAFRTTRGRLETLPPKLVTVDGEIKLRTPLDFAVAPKAIRVAVPLDFKG
jgi:YegS/Rv2252/BmrU family lipid kinase